MINPELQRLASARYLSLTTYRRDGTPVATPVWVVSEGGYLQVVTEASSDTVQRLRHTSEVSVGPCDVRGSLQGDPVAAQAAVIEDPELVQRASRLIMQRYGLFARLLAWVQSLRGRTYVAIAIEVPPAAEATA